MSELVANCPRCGANKITFDVRGAVRIRFEHGWQNWWEAFCICRKCSQSSVFVLSQRRDADRSFVQRNSLIGTEGAINRHVDNRGFVSLKDQVKSKPPEFIPPKVEKVFCEGAACLSIGCNNAAGTMFRLCIDLVTQSLLPEVEVEGLNNGIKRNLGLRLPWLFKNGFLPSDIEGLSACVREDGNDGAHQGTLTNEEAEDLLDFTSLLLERIYAVQGRLEQAKQRREKRREKNA